MATLIHSGIEFELRAFTAEEARQDRRLMRDARRLANKAAAAARVAQGLAQDILRMSAVEGVPLDEALAAAEAAGDEEATADLRLRAQAVDLKKQELQEAARHQEEASEEAENLLDEAEAWQAQAMERVYGDSLGVPLTELDARDFPNLVEATRRFSRGADEGDLGNWLGSGGLWRARRAASAAGTADNSEAATTAGTSPKQAARASTT